MHARWCVASAAALLAPPPQLTVPLPPRLASARPGSVLVFCSNGYFTSRNCMRELKWSVQTGKPIIPLLEPNVLKGGLTLAEVRARCEAYGTLSVHERSSAGVIDKGEVAIADALFMDEPIEWNRFGAFQVPERAPASPLYAAPRPCSDVNTPRRTPSSQPLPPRSTPRPHCAMRPSLHPAPFAAPPAPCRT